MESGTLPRDAGGPANETSMPPGVGAASRIFPDSDWRSLAVVLLGIVLWFGLMDHRPLIDPDEGRYAEIAREMLASGNWTTPRLNGLVYLEKPPLQYWATAIAFKLFGQSNETARLWTMLTGLAGVFLALYAGRRLYSPLAGLYAALILASSFLYFGASHFNSLDMALAFFTETAIFALALALQPRATAAEHRFCIHIAWIACALAVLTKGIAGIVLPGAALVLYSLLSRDFAVWKRLAPATGTTLFLLITIPWFVAVARANPDFTRFFFVHEHFERYLTTVHHRYQPFWFFIPVLLGGTLPWTIPVLMGLWHGLRQPHRTPGFSPERFLAVWSIFVFVFFSMSQSKLVGYIVPVMPPLALLAGRYLCVVEPAGLRWRLLPALAVPVALAGVFCLGLPFTRVHDALHVAAATPYFVIAITLTACASLYALYGTRAALPAVATLALATMVASQVLLASVDIMNPQRTTWHLARQIGPYVGENTRLYSVGLYEQTLPFYLRRKMTLVAYRGELDYGLRLEPYKGLRDIQAFRQAWQNESDAIAIMDMTTYRKLAAAGLPMKLIATDATRIAVGRS